jgi:hypothetical protein
MNADGIFLPFPSSKSEGNEFLNLDLTGYPAGVYMIRLSREGYSFVRKIVRI